MINRENYLTKDMVHNATQTIQAIDSLAGETYLEKFAKKFDPRLSNGEAEVAEVATELTHILPGTIFLMNGHGYRITLSVFINLLISCDREDLAKIAMQSKLAEDE